MRQPSILDVVRAVKTTAVRHPEVSGWWYTPARLLRLEGDRPAGLTPPPALEVVVEHGAVAPDFDAIGRELAELLRGASLKVRPHRGAAEERRLYRLASRGPGERAECPTG
jgi:hypothetical protein